MRPCDVNNSSCKLDTLYLGNWSIDYIYEQHSRRVEVKKWDAVGLVHSVKGSMNNKIDLLVILLKGICIREASSFDHILFSTIRLSISLSLNSVFLFLILMVDVNTELAINSTRWCGVLTVLSYSLQRNESIYGSIHLDSSINL